MKYNLITDVDSYKFSHWVQYPPNTTSMYSYFESRGGKFDSVVFFGLQYILREYLTKPITALDINEAEKLAGLHGEPFNRAGWEKILTKYNGYMPVTVRAVPEGTVVPVNNILFDIQLTDPDPDVFWCVSWLETQLSRAWYGCTVSSLSRECKKIIWNALQRSSDDPAAEIGFKLHDFGARGVSSLESSRIGGAAHLVNFLGTDTVEAIRCADEHYSSGVCAWSIPAAEHSTITSWGREHEVDAYKNFVQKYLIDRVVPVGVPKLAACVSDSYNIYNVVENVWLGSLHDMVKNSGGKLVIRPDSGEPVEVILNILGIFDRKMHLKINNKGYKVLPDYYGLIQGDGVNIESISEILEAMMRAGFSASNIAFGMGGKLLQADIHRDVQKFAFKCSSILVNGKWEGVKKSPITDPGKNSKSGRLALLPGINPGEFVTVQGPAGNDILVPVFKNGKMLVEYKFEDIRARAAVK